MADTMTPTTPFNLGVTMDLFTCSLLAGITLAMTLSLLHIMVWWTQEKAEPPVLGNSIPFITPLFGILKHRTEYMVKLRDSHSSLAVYTLRLPGSRTYVVNSPSFVPLLQRQRRNIAFEPIPAQAAANIMGVSKTGLEIISRNCTEDNAYFGTFLKATHPSLAPGAGLKALQKVSVQVLAAHMDKLESAGQSIKMDLWDFIRHEIVIATTEAIYGEGNPFRDSVNEQAYYNFEDGMMLQMLQVHKLFSQGRSSLEGREVLVRAFRRYFDDKLHEDATKASLCLVQARYKHNLTHGLHSEDIARTEIGQVAASLSNTTPGAFWMVWHVLSDPVVLADCRREIETLTTMEIIPYWDSDDRLLKREICTIDFTKLTDRRACPSLVSTWQEVLRFNHVGISARVVMEDVFLGGYLLKKGSTAMVVSPVMHSDTSVWGSSAREFRHRRFSSTRSNADDREHLTSAGHDEKPGETSHRKASNLDKSPAYRNFGGGSTLCPGRHLATQEVLSLVALLVMRFDVHPASGRHWIPPRRSVPGPTSMPIPVAGEPSDLQVEMVPRFPGREWRVVFHSH